MFIRADGNERIGFGHLVRCMALANMLRDDFDISFCVVESKEIHTRQLVEAGFKVIQLEGESIFIDSLMGTEIVVLDLYKFDSRYQHKIRRKGCFLICIDDNQEQSFDCDIILNHSPGVSKDSYSINDKETVFMLGPKYALLRAGFIARAQHNRVFNKIDHVLICFGGSDPRNFTEMTLKTVRSFPIFTRITVVTGSGYRHREQLKLLNSSDDRIQYYSSLNEKEMIDCFLDANLAIVPSSGILFEAIACKLPIISGYYLDNQHNIYEGFKSHNTFFDAIDFSYLNLKDALRLAFSSDCSDMIANQKTCIDGNSPLRIKKELCAAIGKWSHLE